MFCFIKCRHVNQFLGFGDLACSYYVTPYRDWFDTHRLINCGLVLMGNKVVCKVVGIGTIEVKMFNDVVRTLKDVRHVLDLKKKNLISLGTLSSNGFRYKYENEIIKVSKGAMVMLKGQKVNGNIYRLLGSTIYRWSYYIY